MALKINGNTNKKPNNLRTNTGQDGGRVSKKSGSQFNTHLGKHLSQNQDEELRKMAMRIEEQGKRLTEHIDIYELKAYKKLIMEFLDEAVRGFGRYSKDSFLDRRGRHRVFATVKTINKELEQLTQDVLSSESDSLTIIGRIEDIRGLVLDLML